MDQVKTMENLNLKCPFMAIFSTVMDETPFEGIWALVQEFSGDEYTTGSTLR